MENASSINNYLAYEYADKLDNVDENIKGEIILDDVFSIQFDDCLRLIGYEVCRINVSTILVKSKGRSIS